MKYKTDGAWLKRAEFKVFKRPTEPRLVQQSYVTIDNITYEDLGKLIKIFEDDGWVVE